LVAEKKCVVVVWVAKKLRHYLLDHHIKGVAKANMLNYLLEWLVLQGWISQWVALLSKYDLTFQDQKMIKGSAVLKF